jgi:putative FmdB family regulatory protein
MPTYEYLCQDCGERLEVFQKFTDKPLRTHPECGGSLNKVFHASGVVFKGSGYYVTDSRPKGKGSPAHSKPSDGSTADSSTSDKKSEKSSTSKSAAAAAD